MKKVLALVLAALLLLSATAVLAEEKTTLTLWSIATESDSNHDAYVKAIEEYNAAHTDSEIVMEATENEAYKTKIKAAMSAGEGLPDIFFTWSLAFLGDFVKADRVYCLDDAYAEYASELPEVMTANTTYDGKHYGVPLSMNVVTLFANMDLLAQAGWDEIPATYEDMQKCCDDLLAAGIIPFGVAGKETWCVTEYLEPMIIKSIGYEELGKIFAGESTWNNEGIAKAVDAFQDMINKGYFDPSALALSNDEVKANFIAGKTAFYQNGSWNCADIAKSENAASFKAGLFPVLDTEKATLGQLIGGPNDSLAVTASGVNPEMAAKAAFELGRTIAREGYLNGAGLPAWAVNYDASNINPLTAAVAEIVANADGMVLFGDNAQSADAANTYLDYVAQVYGCEINGADFIAGLSADLQ